LAAHLQVPSASTSSHVFAVGLYRLCALLPTTRLYRHKAVNEAFLVLHDECATRKFHPFQQTNRERMLLSIIVSQRQHNCWESATKNPRQPNDLTAALLDDSEDSDYEQVHKCAIGPKIPVKHLKAAFRNIFYSNQDYSNTISNIREDLKLEAGLLKLLAVRAELFAKELSRKAKRKARLASADDNHEERLDN
jgi:hypothetical protein